MFGLKKIAGQANLKVKPDMKGVDMANSVYTVEKDFTPDDNLKFKAEVGKSITLTSLFFHRINKNFSLGIASRTDPLRMWQTKDIEAQRFGIMFSFNY